MSELSRAVSNARAALRIDQPPVFVRTNWLFVEIDEALERAAQISVKLKVARLAQNPIEARRLNNELAVAAKQLVTICGWADEQFRRELP